MIPVDRASPLTEISPHSYFFCKNSMCSYEKAGQPGYRYFSVSATEISGVRDENFLI